MPTPVQLGKGNLWTIGAVACVMYQPGGITPIAGYITPNFQTLSGNHEGPLKATIFGQEGQLVSKMYALDDRLTMNADFVPQGSTLTEAKVAATIPVAGTVLVFTGFPIIQIGRFTDAFNGPVNGAPVWVYEAGGRITFNNQGAAAASLVLEKCLYITSGVPVS